MAIISTHPKMLHEIFSEVDQTLDVSYALKSVFSIPYVRQYMELAVCEAWTTIDVSEIKVFDYNYHVSMAGAFLLNKQTYKLVSEVLMNESVPNATKIHQFKSLSEMLYKEEALILKLILEKNLSMLYTNITFPEICSSLNLK